MLWCEVVPVWATDPSAGYIQYPDCSFAAQLGRHEIRTVDLDRKGEWMREQRKKMREQQEAKIIKER